jgi:hypothetical protein
MTHSCNRPAKHRFRTYNDGRKPKWRPDELYVLPLRLMLKRTGSKCIVVDGQTYRYVVSEVGAANGASVSLALTVQHAATNGARLRVTGLKATRVPEGESKCYRGRTIGSPLQPRDAEHLIRMAKSRGWQPTVAGKTYALGC